ncbi:MAG: type II toxin-antitoxin system HicB family antitoxin [Myxococcaceae bacterium]
MEWLILSEEEDGRWFGEVPSLPGVMVYGESREEAARLTLDLARRVVADRIAHGESVPEFLRQEGVLEQRVA